MNKRKFSSSRLYKLTKWFVIIVSTVSLILAVFSFMDVQVNNTTLNNWEEYCSQEVSEDHLQCMAIGLGQVNGIQNAMYKEFMVGIFLPILFFGSVGLYRYLFPKQHKKLHD